MQNGLKNVFTVDLEEWFHGLTSTNRQPERWPALESRVLQATRTLLSVLENARVQATFFVLGHVADHHPRLIEEIRTAGHELGIHGYAHRFVYRLTPADFDAEIEQSIAALHRITGEMPLGHRAPYFSVNGETPWAFDVLARQGLRYDSSVFPTRNMLYGFPGAPRFPYVMQTAAGPLVQLPASTVRVGGVNLPMAGGFYVRTLPYAAIRWAVRRLNSMGKPAILYVHPWEIDTGQRYFDVTPRERITHYWGRAGLVDKLARLLDEFDFCPACDLAAQIAPPPSTSISLPVGADEQREWSVSV